MNLVHARSVVNLCGTWNELRSNMNLLTCYYLYSLLCGTQKSRNNSLSGYSGSSKILYTTLYLHEQIVCANKAKKSALQFTIKCSLSIIHGREVCTKNTVSQHIITGNTCGLIFERRIYFTAILTLFSREWEEEYICHRNYDTRKKMNLPSSSNTFS